MIRIASLSALLLLALPSLLLPVSAQPNNAPPGTVCVTPTFWCWAVRPGPPGAPCACQTSNGWVQGVLR